MFKKFTSIEKFSDVWVQLGKQEIPEITYREKIKLHGTNAAVRIVDGTVSFQKRTGDITPLADNAGFAGWANLVDWKTDKDVIIYGEWAGPGIQKSDAVSSIDKKMFFVFGVLNGFFMVIDPELIKDYLPEHDQIKIIPWFDEPTTIQSDLTETARKYVDKLNTQVEAIGKEDPYIKEMFGVSGVGEGLVAAPYNPSGVVPVDFYNTFVFKVKSEAHLTQKSATGKSATMYVEVPGSVKEFCDAFVTDARAEQMVTEHLGGSYSLKGTGTFIKAMNEDVLKESRNELAAMNVEWKLVSKEIGKRAVAWLKAKQTV